MRKPREGRSVHNPVAHAAGGWKIRVIEEDGSEKYHYRARREVAELLVRALRGENVDVPPPGREDWRLLLLREGEAMHTEGKKRGTMIFGELMKGYKLIRDDYLVEEGDRARKADDEPPVEDLRAELAELKALAGGG